jgi:hypothetical protein
VDEVGLGEQVAEEPGAGPEGRPSVRLRHDVDVLHLQEVAGMRPLDEHRAGQWMADLLVPPLDDVHAHAGADLAVGGVPGLEDDLLAGGCLQDRRHVGVPAVVPRVRLVTQSLAAIDRHALHGGQAPSQW